MTKKVFRALVPALVWAFIAAAANAQNYPAKPVLIIVPNSPGSAVDLVVRLLANTLNEQKTSFIVENRMGANGMIGTAAVAKATPDGYTLLYSTPTHYINQYLYKKDMSYDPVKDFTPVVRISNTPIILVVPQSVPVNSLAELIAYVRARPGKLNYSSIGRGSGATHLPAALLSSMAKLDIVHVPYKDGTQATVDVISGQIFMTFIAVSRALPLIKEGNLKGIAVAGIKRSPSLPNIPTIAEAGLSGYEAGAWTGMFAPARMPQELVGRLETLFLKVGTAPEFTQKLVAAGLESEALGSKAFADRLQAEMPLLVKSVEAAGIKDE